jgi:hypothetical protein
MCPIPNIMIAGVPTACDCCMSQFHKKAEGEREASLAKPYTCDSGLTARGPTRIKLVLNTFGPPCDQRPRLVPDGSVLAAKGQTIRREDGFAHFLGAFSLTGPTGTLLFSGRIEVIDRIGTHHPPFGPEVCNQPEHLEGWLVGKGQGELSSFTLRALLVAKGYMSPSGGNSKIESGSLDGVLLKCPDC